MKKIAKFLIPVIIALVLITWYTEEKYGLGIVEYWEYASSLNVWEKSYLEQNGGIKYGIDDNSAPLSFYDENTGEMGGIVGDYMSTLSIEAGVPVEFVRIGTDEKTEALKQGEINTTDLFKNGDGDNSFIYTQEIYKLEGAVIKNIDNTKIRKIRNLRDKTVAVISGDYSEKVLSKMFNSGNIEFYYVKNIQQAIDLIEEDKVDAIAGDKMVLQYYLNNDTSLENSYELLDESLYSKSVTLAVNKDDKMLRSILNKCIFSIKKKNLLPQIQDKWLGTSGMITADNKSNTWVPVFFGVILILGAALYLWDKFLRRKIRTATSEIQEQKNSLRAIIDSVHFALFVIDDNEIVLECNDESTKIVTAKYEDVLNRNIYDLPLIGELYTQYSEGKQHNQRYDNQYYYIDTHIISDQSNAKIVLCEDITKRVRVEKELGQKNKMVAVGQLSAGLAHEIRNPLGLIKNYRYIINEYANDEISQHAVEVIGESVDRINSLIENLLNFSKPGRDMYSKFEPEIVLGNFCMLEKKRCAKSGINLDIQIENNLSVVTNEEIFKIVVYNLVNNAVDALMGYDTQENKNIIIRMYSQSKSVVVEVEDNGPGMDSIKIEKIFNPFYTTKDEGTGLGLYIVSTELEKIAGTISVKSVEYEKTVFTVEIPNIERIEHDENKEL